VILVSEQFEELTAGTFVVRGISTHCNDMSEEGYNISRLASSLNYYIHEGTM
jgi:hypothetical protein